MLVENQKIQIKWSNANKKYYQDKGYIFTGNGKCFDVDANDLMHGTNINVKIKCDCCGREYEMTCAGYFKGYEKSVRNNTQLNHFCDECQLKYRQENLYSKALWACEQQGYALLSNRSEISCNTSYVRYLCPLHGEHQMRVANLSAGQEMSRLCE